MPKCFVTGIEIPLGEAYVLDVAATHQLLRDLRQRMATIERLIEQLGQHDEVEWRDHRTKKMMKRRDRRLISRSVSQAISEAWPEKQLFIGWSEWRARRRSNIQKGTLSK